MLVGASPDIHITIEDQVAEGDRVASRWTFRGTHTGDLMGLAPTNKQVTATGMVMDRVADGRIVEHWLEFDQMAMMQQLGDFPAP